MREPQPSTIDDPARLASLDRSGLLDGPVEAFDQVAAMVAAQCDAPVGLVSLVTADHQQFVGAHGLEEPLRSERETSLELSFCKTVVERGAPLVIANAHDDADFRDHGAVRELGVIAYAGTPVTDADGRVLGALCLIDHVPREWSTLELETLDRLGELTGAIVRSRAQRFTR